MSFPPIDKADAESMCLPMLDQAAPRVPDAAWRHSGAWIDGFPSRAGLVTTFEAEHEGRTFMASCTLPGDYTPAVRPDLDVVPGADDESAIRDHCAYLGHVDLRAWDVAAVDAHDGTLAAALQAPDGTFARCALSTDVAGRVVQVSALPEDGAFLFGRSSEATTLVGRVPEDVVRLVVTTAGDSVELVVTDGVYAAVLGRSEPRRVRAYDAAGEEVPLEADVLPVRCFTPMETGDDGC